MLRKYSPRGPVALDPRAFGLMVFETTAPADQPLVDGVATVCVSGPLEARAGGWFDSYEAIVRRVGNALARQPGRIVLDLDSPGGDAQGCMEAARVIREMCRTAKVPLHAFVRGSACSAAYALACAADDISVTPTAAVGSIGVYEMIISQTEHDAMWGLSYRVVATGSRKTDGNPHVAITDEALAASQVAVDHLGGLFFALVEELRGVPATQVRSLNGAIAIGSDAVAKGLADREVLTVSQLLEAVSARRDDNTTRNPMDEIKKALQAVIDDPNKSDDEKAKAKAALAALAAEPSGGGEGGEGEGEEEGTSAKSAEALAAQALAEVHKMRAEIARREEEAERSTLLASRPDFAPELQKLLRTAPMAMVRSMVQDLPRTANPLAEPSLVQPTRGKGQVDGQAPALPPDQKARLDAQMGLAKPTLGIVDKGSTQLFGAPLPAKKA